MSNYKRKCGSCRHYLINDLRGADRDGYGCDANGRVFGSSYFKRFPFDYSCSRYSEDRNRTDKDIEKAMKALERKYGYRPGNSSWWYIATFVNTTLGTEISEDCFYKIVAFRDNYLQNGLQYISFLVEYDCYGRLIADALSKDPQKEIIAEEILLNHIIPICQEIDSQNMDGAFGKYVELFETLKQLYQITDVTTYKLDRPNALTPDEITSLKREKEA